MALFSFNLLPEQAPPVELLADPSRLSFSLSCHEPSVEIGDEIPAGTCVAISRKMTEPNIHSALSGKVVEADNNRIVLEALSKDNVVESKDVNSIPDRELPETLHRMGFMAGCELQRPILIINAMPCDPEDSMPEALLRDYRKTVEAGLGLIKRIAKPDQVVMACVKGMQVNVLGGSSVREFPSKYPHNLAPLVMKAITGQEVRLGEASDTANLISIRTLYHLGVLAETGLPQSHALLSANGRNLRVPIGTPIRFILDHVGLSASIGDKVVLDGLIQGKCALNLEQGIHGTAFSLHVVKSGTYEPVTDSPCIGCGDCVRHCPARLLPNMISRCSEFKLFERAEQYYVHACIECGLCGYYCRASRPLLQYIRLAKYELALLKESCEIPAQEEA